MKDFISLTDYSTANLKELLRIASKLKSMYRVGMQDWCIPGKSMAMIFEKPSLRTRVSFSVAMADLGGHVIYIRPEDIGGLGEREPMKDTARVLSRYAHVIVARTFEHQKVVDLARHSSVPVINALTDWLHPCQAMADVLTIKENFDKLDGLRVVYIGDGNNVARSLAFACAKFGMKLTVASPAGYELDEETIKQANSVAKGSVTQVSDAPKGVADAQVIYTDTWVSMGQEQQQEQRVKDFIAFRVNAELLKEAPDGVKIMHCLPAHRGMEITDEVFESKNSLILDQAENRLHFQRALLKKLLGPQEQL